jgi:RNA polymerase sporulation-specific sigma factor
LKEDQEKLILLAQKGDQEASERLVTENTGLVWSIARRYFGRGADPDDLYQLGCVGFLKAISGFDPAYGTQFSTYAVPKIAGEIRRFLRDDGAVKVSRSVKELSAGVKLARQQMTGELGREPTLSELSQRLGVPPEEIAGAETATSAAESIQQETGEEGFTLEDVLSTGGMEDRILEDLTLKDALRRLPERERLVIDLRYFRGLTQEKVAKVIGVSQVQISRIEKKALVSLREFL